MGLTFSRSIRVGAVRFNFSGSGIGVSTGIKGLRIGTGPRGAYISAGVGGFRYRTSLGGGRRPTPRSVQPRAPAVPVTPPSAAQNIVHSVEHDTLSVLDLSDSTSDALLESMNEQARKVQLWPFVGVGLCVLFIWALPLMESWPAWTKWLLFGVGAAVIGWVRHATT